MLTIFTAAAIAAPLQVQVTKGLFRSATKSGQVGGEVPHYRQGSWANTSLPAMPTARCGLAAVAINNTLYAVGGIYGNDDDEHFVSTLEAFDPATRTWDSSLPDMPSKRAYAAAVAINNVLYAVGGEDANGNYLDKLEAFDPATRKWDRSLPSMSTRRTSFAAVAINDVLYAVGGSAGDGIFLDTLEAFDPATGKWDRSLPSMSTNRVGLAAVAINNVLYAVGGEDGNGNYLDTLEAFDPATRKWDRPRGGWGRSKKRSYLAAVAINNVLYAVGGDNSNDGFLGTLEAFDPATRQWDHSLPSMSTARTGLAAVAINNVLYAVGGFSGNASGTLDAFDPATRKWDRSLPSMSNTVLSDFGTARLLIADFNGSAPLQWEDTNDPVMGGQSSSSFKVGKDPKFGSIGVFTGDNKIVPSLSAPGFCNAHGSFPKPLDLTAFAYMTGGSAAIRMVARTSTPEYQGFKFAFGGHGVPKTSIFGGGSFKAGFNMTGTLFQQVTIPMARFSYDWSGFTGGCDTKDPKRGFDQQHYCCTGSGESPSKDKVCPSAQYLSAVSSVELWAEGTAGLFDLEVVSIEIVSSF